MGFRSSLTLFPLMVLFVLTVISTAGTFSTSGQSVGFQGNGLGNTGGATTFDCKAISGGGSDCYAAGPPLPSNSLFRCTTTLPSVGDCTLYSGCPSPTYAGTYCSYFLYVFPVATKFAAGSSIFIDSTGASTSSASNNPTAAFSFGAIGGAGFIVIVGVAIGLAALAGISLFGSGENSESVQILFTGGLMLGLWAILSAAEGFIGGSTTSFFVQLNTAFGGLGTLFYIALTLPYVAGVIAGITRGS